MKVMMITQGGCVGCRFCSSVQRILTRDDEVDDDDDDDVDDAGGVGGGRDDEDDDDYQRRESGLRVKKRF